MSYLSNELAAIAQKNGIRQKHVRAATGFSVAHISRIFTGSQDYVTSKDLKKIIDAVARTPQERARLIRARMRDVYTEEDADLVKITIKGGAPPPDRLPSHEIAVDPAIKAAFEFLYRLAPANPAIGQSMTGFARAMGMQ